MNFVTTAEGFASNLLLERRESRGVDAYCELSGILGPRKIVRQTEDLIIGDILNGNKERYAELVQKYNQRLYRIGRGYLSRPADVEDAMQEAYVKAYLSLATLGERQFFGTWLTRIFINECLQRLRRMKKTEALEVDRDERLEVPGETDPASEAMQKEFRNVFEKCVEQLPEKYRVVYVMREVERMSTAETAAALGITETNVKVRLNRSRELLKQKVLEAYPAAELYHFMGARCEAMTARVMRRINTLSPVPAKAE